MSDSRFPHLTPAAAGQTPDKAALAQAKFNAKVQEISRELQNLQAAKRIQGEIVAAKNNGEVTIKTPQGQVTLQITNKAQYTQGQSVEIYLAKGNPPAQALVTLAKALPPPPPQVPQAVVKDIGAIPEIPSTTAQNVNGLEATLTALPLNKLAAIVKPYTEILQSTLDDFLLQNILSTPATQAEQPLAIFPLQDVPPPVFQNAFTQGLGFSPEPSEDGELSRLPRFSENPHIVTFRNIAAYVFKSETANFLSVPPPEPYASQAPHRLSSFPVTLNAVEHPAPHSEFPRPILLSQAFESLGTIEGFTPDRFLPVLRIASDSGNPLFFVLDVDITDARSGDIVKFIPLQGDSLQTASILPQNIQITGLSGNFLPQQWHNFEEMLATLQQTTPQAAQAIANMTLMPANAPQNLGGVALFFIAALRSGDLQGWLGSNAVNALKRAGKDSLLNSIRQEGFSHSSIDSAGQEWRSSSLPLSWSNDIHKIILHVRQDDHKDSKDDERNKNHTRFVIDLNLSNIGPVQLDALHKKITGSADKLDLVLRTESNFSKAAQAEMTALYKKAIEESKMTGDLIFQTHTDHWVKISPDYEKAYSENI